MTFLDLVLFVLLPFAAVLTAFWAAYRYPQHWRLCLSIFIFSTAATLPVVVPETELWIGVGAATFVFVFGLMSPVFLILLFPMLLIRLFEERKYDAIPPNSYEDTANCLKDLVNCIRNGVAKDASSRQEQVLGNERLPGFEQVRND